VYLEHFHPLYSVRTSMTDYRVSVQKGKYPHTMIHLPLYAVNQIRKECGDSVEEI